MTNCTHMEEEEEPVETLVVDQGLQIVINSIENSRPDRTAVIEWLVAEKTKNPFISFADLATMLDDAGVPTLSGRVGWNRNSLSKMIPKREKEDL